MAITAAGAGSGLDIEGIVSQLMSLERRPINVLERRESEYQAKLSAFGRMKSAISTFQTAMKDLSSLDKFKVFSATSSDATVLSATADSKAAAGTYNVVVDRLAQNHKQGSAQFADTTTFGGTAGDSMTLTVAGKAMTVDLSTAQTLSQIRDTVNADTTNPGVTATILNTGGGNQQLILTSDQSGYDQRVDLTYGGTVTATTFNFATLNTDPAGATLTDLTLLDAAYSIDGTALTAASNKITGVIDGLTLNLEKVGSSTLTLTRDTTKITEAAKSFVDAYNSLQGTFASQRANDLAGDSAIPSIQRQLRGVINTPPVGLTGVFDSLSSVGIKTDAKTGELIFTESDFTAALDTDLQGVAEMFANNNQGYAFRFQSLADSLVAADGLIDLRQDGLNGRIRDIQDRKLDFESRLQLREKALRSQYSALDTLVGRLNSTSQFLFQQLG